MYLNLPDVDLKTNIRGPGERSIKYKIKEGQYCFLIDSKTLKGKT